ncbi:hypothetical protein [Natronococcus sp. A-GB7]|uniref:hypothetical protein n=1 Tax=Natronococcus sp. A-GB7 TaxID=3037649 RepID=UPI00241E737D|nr:hypothetical protein [Natronococcus sp. A-GB7]MDG5817480.1 hypothetical protein [Natronococcus sp. A-GB7]
MGVSGRASPVAELDEVQRGDVREACDELDLECFLVEEATDRGLTLASVPVPTGAVDGALRELREQGLEAEIEDDSSPEIGKIRA